MHVAYSPSIINEKEKINDGAALTPAAIDDAMKNTILKL